MKKEYVTPVCRAIEMGSLTMLASSDNAKSKATLNVNNDDDNAYFYGATNKKNFFDDVW